MIQEGTQEGTVPVARARARETQRATMAPMATAIMVPMMTAVWEPWSSAEEDEGPSSVQGPL